MVVPRWSCAAGVVDYPDRLTLPNADPPTIQIRLLGALDVRKSGVVVELPARKTEALLAVLALRPGVAFGREWLAALLWPDVPEAQGRTSLRQALGHLRKSLSETIIESSGDKIHLAPKAAWVDSAELEQVLARPPIERERVAELWRGNLLEGFPAVEDPFGDWLADERNRFTERVATRQEECLAALSAAGQLERALAVGTRLVDIDPTREAAHRALMRLYTERGDRVLALRQYERCRALLKRHLDIAPSAETERLCRAISTAETELSNRISAADARSPSDLDGRTILAVLPFEASEQQARLLADGLTEDVITELSRFRQLALIARATISALVERERSPDKIAAETGARLVLSGSVRVAAARARVTAALVEATTGLQLWAERWEVPCDDFFGVLDRLTKSLVSALALSIDESSLGQTRGMPRERLEVYQCWLRGLESLRRGTPESDEEARGFFDQALALSPRFARAYSGISLSHFNDWSCQAWDRWDERERLAFENARRAVELDDSDHVTHVILGRIYVYRREFERGERHLERAVSLNPNDADMLMQAATAFAQLGEGERACELADSALSLNPRHADWYYPCVAFARVVARRPDEAIKLALQAPDALVDTRALLAIACAHQGQDAAAREHARRFLDHFRQKITAGREPAPGEPARWLLHVNALKRAADAEYLIEGLVRAGVDPP